MMRTHLTLGGLLGVALVVSFFVLRAWAASVVIDGSIDPTTTQHNMGSPQTVFTATSTGYAFFVDSNNTCVYRKTYDGGANWGNAVTVDSQTDCEKVAVWYDQWTPGDDSGTYIHIATIDINEDDIFYTRLDTSNDSVSTTVNITSGSSYVGVFTTAVNVPTITRGTDGALYAAVLDASDSIVVRCSATCTTNTNWTETSPTWTLGDDIPILVPLLSGSVMLIQWDISADDLLSKVYSGSWDAGWATIEANAADNTTYDAAFGAAIDRASGNVYLVAVDDASTLGTDDDVKTWRYTAGAWGARTDAVSGSSCAGVSGCGITDAAVAVDQYSGDVYVIYSARSTAATANTANVYWKRSTDQMSSWGSEQGGLDSSTGDLYGGASVSLMGPRIYARWYESGVDDLSGETILLPTLTVATSGTQTTNIEIGGTDEYVGGTFVFTHDTSSSTVQSITITETGTVDAATDLDNIQLLWEYDTVAPLDCASVAFGGTESQYGATDTDGFSSANGTSTFTGSLSVSTTSALCVYVELDVSAGATNGETLDIEISSPDPHVVISRGAVAPASSVRALGGSTTLLDDVLTQTHYHWRNDDGSEAAATSATGGTEDTSYASYPVQGSKRLRLQVSNEGAATSPAITYRLEYGEKITTCDAATWVDVGAAGGDWDMVNSANLTDGSDTTNVAVAGGGVSNENTTFETPNAGVKDTSSQTASITLLDTEYVELEFSIMASSSATAGESFCFRVSNAGTDLAVYDAYAEAAIGADVLVTSIGTQEVSVVIPTANQYVGGTFVIAEQGSSRNVSAVTITETGTVDASTGLDNIRLYHESDTSAPYDCASESYGGSEDQYGATDTDGFSAANGVSAFSESVGISLTSTLCLYVVVDVTLTAGNGNVLDIEISDATADVTVSAGSTSPSSPVALSGSTSLEAALLTQTHYHFRNDDGSESSATSATGGVQDTALSRVNKNEIQRVRLQVSNEGLAVSSGAVYRLEYGQRSSTCDAIATWVEVGAVGGAFDISNSTNLTHGDDTTNIAESSGGVDNENTDFETPNAGVRDTSGDSGAVTLDSSDYVELEYALEATDSALDATAYCFRLTQTGTELYAYTNYPTLTTEAANDFLVQRGVATIANTATTATITAGTDYIAPKSTSSAFIRITNSQHTGAGHNVGGGNQNASNVTANIANPDNLLTSINFQRVGTTNTTRIAWEIVEYIGPAGGDNEVKVRMASSTVFAAANLGATTTVTGVVDDADVVVWVTGSRNPDVGAADYNTMLVTSEWLSSSDQAELKRQEASGDAIAVSWAAVEYTGSNWRTQRISHTYASAGVFETETIPTTLASSTMAFVHTQRRAGAGLAGTDEFGHEVYLSSTSQVSFQIQSGATSPALQTSVAWVIENLQTTGAPMNVQRVANSQTGGAEPLTTNVSIPASITATTTASIFINNRNDGTGTTYPRPIIGARIISGTQFELWNSDTGLTRNYRVEIVSWPTAVRTLTQNFYQFYVDNDALDPTDRWPVGATNLGENTSITASDDPLGTNELVRIRMSVTVRGANLAASSTSFRLQYGVRTVSCAAITSWLDVGDTSSSTAPWRGYDASPSSGTALSGNPPSGGDLNLSVADRAGTYEENVYTAPTPYKVYIGEDLEYDWILERNTAPDFTTYCFRMVEFDGSPLDSYAFHPTLLTAGFLVESQSWRWYNDETNETPTTALANENVAPTNVAFDNAVKLRMTALETGGADGLNVKFKLQFSEASDFSSGVFDVTEIGPCVASDLWCYADGAGLDNATSTTNVLTDSDTCVAAAGAGCGSHNESGTSPSTFSQVSGAASEYEFTLRNAGARVNTVYYFRIYDVTNDVAVATGGTYPSLTTEGATLAFSISGVLSGTVTEGVTTDLTTTPTSVPFGVLAYDTEVEAAQRLSVTTNATGGYRVYVLSRQGLTNGSADIDPVTGTNGTPTAWGTGCTGTGCFGYHTGDDVLAGSSARFAPNDTFAQFATSLAEVAYSGVPISSDLTDIVYKTEISEGQEGGDYETSIVFIVTPVF